MKTSKRIVPILLLLSTLLLLFCACGRQVTQEEPPADPPFLWDGTVATAFAGGNGTKEDPYLITNAEEFAYFAHRVNYVKGYQDKVYSLMCNVDLNHIDWIPVGNRTLPFSGSFLGNGHTVSNLTVTRGVTFEKPYVLARAQRYAMGMFGNCANAVIRDLRVDGARIVVTSVPQWYDTAIGIVAGSYRADAVSEISGIKITNSEIVTEFEPNEWGQAGGALNIGGVCGEITTTGESGNFTAQGIQVDVSITYRADCHSVNTVGGIFGSVVPARSVRIADCANYTTVNLIIKSNNRYWNDVGAIGSAIRCGGDIEISNVFSKVMLCLDIGPELKLSPLFRANAVIGSMYFYGQGSSAEYRLSNLFGYVEQTDANNPKAKAEIRSVYESLNPVSAENCIGATSLPDGHGFDPAIWDLSDLSHPNIK